MANRVSRVGKYHGLSGLSDAVARHPARQLLDSCSGDSYINFPNDDAPYELVSRIAEDNVIRFSRVSGRASVGAVRRAHSSPCRPGRFTTLWSKVR